MRRRKDFSERKVEKPCIQCGRLTSGRYSRRYCDDCLRERNRISGREAKRKDRARPGYKAKYREWFLRKTYGIGMAELNEIIERQGSACAVCRAVFSGWSKKWHVDHCHETNRVRGVLCQLCNHLLGNAKDSTQILLSAVEYLKS